MADCVESINVLCKHVASNGTRYVDLAPALGTNRTVASVTSVTCTDSALTAGTPSVLTGGYTDTRTVRDEDGNTTTTTYVIAANKGVSFTLTGGTTGGGCSIVRVKFVDSSGETEAVDCLIEVHGVDV